MFIATWPFSKALSALNSSPKPAWNLVSLSDAVVVDQALLPGEQVLPGLVAADGRLAVLGQPLRAASEAKCAAEFS
jgi:hypothetical protein